MSRRGGMLDGLNKARRKSLRKAIAANRRRMQAEERRKSNQREHEKRMQAIFDAEASRPVR